MDILQEYAVEAYKLYLAADPYLQPVRQMASKIQSQTLPLLTPLVDQFTAFAQESPAIITVGIFILVLLIALQVINVVRRIMMFWVTLVMRLLFWGMVGLLISLVLQRGVGKTVEDLKSWGEEIGRVWWVEYRKWEGAKSSGSGKRYSSSARAGGRKNWS